MERNGYRDQIVIMLHSVMWVCLCIAKHIHCLCIIALCYVYYYPSMFPLYIRPLSITCYYLEGNRERD